jgi:zinc/manganese transport system substrate-binding protein
MIIIPARMTLRTIFIIGVCLALAMAGCGADDDGDELQVVATTGIVADLVEHVAGPEVEVVQLIPDGGSPHDFQLSAEDRLELERADLIAAVGAGLEAGIPLDEVGVARWQLSDHVGRLLPFGEAGAHEHEAGEEGVEGASDPHVWMDPARVASALPSLAAALANADPATAGAYGRRARAYAGQLRDLDRELRSTLDAVPADSRELVTSHDSLGYLANRYGFEVVATAFPSSGPEAEASTAQLQEVIDAIAEHGVPTIFAQEEDDPEALRLVAEEAGVGIEEGLIIESPGSAGSYEEMLRRDAELISSGLDRP